MPTTAIDYRFARSRNDLQHCDEHLIEDATASERAADYRLAIPYDDDQLEEMAERLMDEPKVLETLMAIALAGDAHMAGLHLAAFANILADKQARKLAEMDKGEAQQLNCHRDSVVFEMRVEAIKAALRKG